MYCTHRFDYDWRYSISESVPADDDLAIAIHPEVTTLSMRIITDRGSMMSYAYSVVDGRQYVVTPSMARHHAGDRRFTALCLRISRALGVSVEDLARYAEQGISAYRDLTRGMDIEYVYPNAITGGIIQDAGRAR